MFKKIVLFVFLFTVLVSPLTTQASSFTSLKAQLFYLTNQISNFKLSGEVLGVSSSPAVIFTANPPRIAYDGSSTLT